MTTVNTLLQSLIDTSVQLDNIFSLDSGDRDDCTYTFVNEVDWQYLYEEDDEAEIIFDSESFSVMYSPNFSSNVVLKK